MTAPRPVELIRHELETALALRARYEARSPVDDPWAQRMVQDNEHDVERLSAELALALSGDLQVSLDGTPVEDHRISVPYLNRVLEALQATYRAVLRSMASEKLRRTDYTLAMSGTAPGSFKVLLRVPPAQMQLLEEPLVDRAMDVIVELMAAAEQGTVAERGPEWAASADESAVRAMIRLASALAGAKGTAHVRWRAASGQERTVTVTAEAARSLAIALAGEAGREILTVTGHLEMGQDRPPRVRIRTSEDEYVAAVDNPELLDRIKELLFEEVVATLVIDMRTSPTTGSPGIDVELLDLDSAS